MKRPDPMIELITKPSGGSSSYPRSASPSRSEPFTSSSISVSISDATSTNASSRAHEHEHVEDINAPYGLRELEQGWRALQPFLLRRGYSLRRRYWPGWVGSWVGTPLDPLECEDSIVVEANVLDAVRVSDGAQVVLKIHSPVDPLPKQQEISTLRYFSSTSLADDPHNHVLPLLDVLEVPGTGSFDWTDVPEGASAGASGIRIAVMPLLRDWYSPPFCMAVEALVFIKQMLEGLAFLHAHGVAHRNICASTILMDARDLFPSGFHGAYNMNPNHRVSEAQLPRRTRLAVPHPVKYYYTGFGASARVDQAPDLDTVARPSGAAEDAFAADVYALGKLLAHFFRDGHTNLTLLDPLFASMLAPPAQRPTAAACLAQFHTLTRRGGGLSRWRRMTRLGYRWGLKGVGWKMRAEGLARWLGLVVEGATGGWRGGVGLEF
ncbi:hypothetical protein HETIRDRAFT_419350 [Heterobasidion irregulare TC 32-1]|uniref:Protein kinase domain-containing protein n=1 Tax=Heterobasidion irregulare (strain TC 32-1) TaxID=747525 RepID=W4K3P0_HETIT|nr:uncharacterized protein HETIRDRAFT_419350 [Heterobasidion irregulare TC 32-1]ETW79686.1 hypothetical protein HETIRDRAFT_419350 [Heterobasidion irregulare TC 32-1]